MEKVSMEVATSSHGTPVHFHPFVRRSTSCNYSRNVPLMRPLSHPHAALSSLRVSKRNTSPSGNLKWSRFHGKRTRPPSFSTNRVWRNNHEPVQPTPESHHCATRTESRFIVRGAHPERRHRQKLGPVSEEFTRTNGGFSLVRESSTTMSSRRESVQSIASARGTAYHVNQLRKRAETAVERARALRAKASQVRTEYCLFFNRYGFCNKRNACKYIHDSRKVAVCREFLKGNCHDTTCKLSHTQDQNKMPVCIQFLRGICAREPCPYRHVKVSGHAQLCQAFLRGFCPLGHQCRLKHELPATNTATKRNGVETHSTTSQAGSQTEDETRRDDQRSFVSEALAQPCALDGCATLSNDDLLSIRPNIQFVSKHTKGLCFLTKRGVS